MASELIRYWCACGLVTLALVALLAAATGATRIVVDYLAATLLARGWWAAYTFTCMLWVLAAVPWSGVAACAVFDWVIWLVMR